ncbi:MAG: hypothetical protein OXQ31_19405 [Spirochaetaceae bacterium]|nr:hypothetical protein [Spirochaetaceae bacterium]
MSRSLIDAMLDAEDPRERSPAAYAEVGRREAARIRLFLRLKGESDPDRARLSERERRAVDHPSDYGVWETHTAEGRRLVAEDADLAAVKAEADHIRNMILERAHREGWLYPPGHAERRAKAA